jgi:hypothetical protein
LFSKVNSVSDSCRHLQVRIERRSLPVCVGNALLPSLVDTP